MADPIKIADKSSLHRYRIELPILIDDTELTVYEFRLYVHMKRRAGDDGACWEGTRALAKACNMSLGQIAKAKKGLKDRGLIVIEKYKTPTGDGDRISITDIWPMNFETYAKIEQSTSESVHHTNAIPDEAFTTRTNSVHHTNAKRSYSEQERSRGGSEEDPRKKIPVKRESGKTLENSPAHTPAVNAYFESYSNEALNPEQIAAINRTITDIGRWRKVLEEWKLNGWNGKSIAKMLDRYTSGRTAQDERPIQGGNGTKPADTRPALPIVQPDLNRPDPAESRRKTAELIRQQRGT